MRGTVYFIAYDRSHGEQAGLWKSDGTRAGTALLKDTHPSSAAGLTEVAGTVYFVASDYIGDLLPAHSWELWESDGTEAGTFMVKDIWPGWPPSRPSWLTDVGGTLYFTAKNGAHGRELWESDGTEAGTFMVKDIWPGGDRSQSSEPTELTDVGGTLYFVADDGVHGRELWKSDGTDAGTVMVKDIDPGSVSSCPWTSNPSLTEVGGALYFVARDGIHGQEVWKSDGTGPGTVLVKDIWAGGYRSEPSELTDVGGTLYIAADDGVHNVELWRSDGTRAGTVMVKDIWPGSPTSRPSWLTDVGGTLYFTADDGTHGRELWETDGTEVGTFMVKDIWPGGEYGFSSGASELTDVGGTLYFRADDGTHGSALWRSDGTEAGTLMVKDVGGNWGDFLYPDQLIDAGGTLYFADVELTHGAELWKSDGTEAGTVMVKDIWVGAGSSWPQELVYVPG